MILVAFLLFLIIVFVLGPIFFLYLVISAAAHGQLRIQQDQTKENADVEQK